MAANATDLRLFYSHVQGPTLLLAVGAVGDQTRDEDGPLPEGRYLVRALRLTGICWVRAVKFVAGDTSATTIVTPDVAGMNPNPGLPSNVLFTDAMPLDTVSGVRSLELNVRDSRNNRIQARCSGGTAVLAITRIGE